MKPNLIAIGTLIGLCVCACFRSAAAALSIQELANGQVQIVWPTDAASFSLEQADSLISPVPWRAVNDTVVNAGGRFSVLIQPSTQTRFYRLRAVATVTRIIETSPAFGESGVAVTRETIFRFSGPLAADTMLTLANISAEFGARRILSRVELSGDRRTATLFYLENLPASARIRVTFNGGGVKDASGRDLDADGDGQPGGIATFSFDTLGTVPVPATAVIGRVFASELVPGPSGGSTNRPLAGVTISVDGAEETLRTTTGATGYFSLSPCPAGEFFVHIDGRTSPLSQWPDGAFYPVVGKSWSAVAGRTNNLAGGTGEVFLPLIVPNTLQTVSMTEGTEITFPNQVLQEHPELAGVSVMVPANSLFSENGTRGGRVGIAPVPPDRLPGPLPPGLEFPLVITVQTDGPLNFDRAAPVRFPNLPDPVTGQLLRPGAKTALWSFNHDTGRWEIQGPMTISPDGLFAVSDPGVGLRAPGWHGVNPGSGGSGGGAGGPGGGCPNPPCEEDDDNDDDDGDPCKKERNLVISGDAQCGLETLGATAQAVITAGESIPLLGCAISIGLGVGGAIDECSVDFDNCEKSILSQTVGTLIGCIPIVGGVGGLFYNCAYQRYEANQAYRECQRRNRRTAHLRVRLAQSAADIPDDIFAEQAELWADAASLYALVCGNANWTVVHPADWPLAHAIFSTIQQDIQPGSAGGERIVQSERDAIVQLARPANITVADLSALIDRFDSLVAGQLSPAEFNAGAIGAAATKLKNTALELQSRGWETTFDAFLRGLTELAQEQDEAAGGGGGGSGGAGASLQSQPSTSPSSGGFIARPYVFYRLADLFTGFVQRGRLGASGRFAGLILAPNTLYAIEYADPAALQTAITVFKSAAAGGTVQIPRAILVRDDTSDADQDGLPAETEKIIGTNSSLADTDGDGIKDGAEFLQNTDPLDGLPAAVGIIASADTPGQAVDVSVGNNIVAVADGSAGVAVFKAFAGPALTLVAQLPTARPTEAVAIEGGLLAAATGNGGVVLWDLSAPENPALRHEVNLGRTATEVIVSAGLVYAAVGSEVAVLDGTTGVVLDRRPYTGREPEQVHDLAIAGDHLYVLSASSDISGSHTIHKVTLSPTLAPPVAALTIHGSEHPTFGRMHIFAGGGYIYVGASDDNARTQVPGIEILKDNPSEILLIGAPSPITAFDIEVNGSGTALFTGADPGLTISAKVGLLDVRNPTLTDRFLSAYDTPGAARSLTLYNGLCYVADSNRGLQVLNYLAFDIQGVAPSITLSSSAGTNNLAKDRGRMRVSANATDDVQVRHVEFYVDGVRVSSDGTFPFEHRFPAPMLTSSKTNFTARARAIDTGGNATWSEELMFILVEELTPPSVIAVTPESGSKIPAGTATVVSATFSEPINLATLTSETFQLTAAGSDGIPGTADDKPVTGGSLSFNPTTATAALSFGVPLLEGVYRAAVKPPVADRFGNTLKAEVVWEFEIHPPPPPPVLWNVDGDGFWDEAAKWSTGARPQSGDFVIINRPGGEFTINHRSGISEVLQLDSAENLILSGGTLSIIQRSLISGDFVLAGGTRSGPGELLVDGSFTWERGTFDGGGVTRFASGMNVSGTLSIAKHTLINEGIASFSMAPSFQDRESAFVNGATGVMNIEIPMDRNIVGVASTAPFAVLKNLGAINKLMPSVISIDGLDVRNDGSVEVREGVLNLRRSSVSGGAYRVQKGAELGFANGPHLFGPTASISGAGTVRFGLQGSGSQSDLALFTAEYNVAGATIVEGGAVDFSGPVLNVGETLLVSGGRASFNHRQTAISGAIEISGTFAPGGRADFSQQVTIITPTSLTLSGSGTLGGFGVIAPSGKLSWSGGTMTGLGTTRANGSLEISGDTTKALRESRTLENAGVGVWTGNGDLVFEAEAKLVNLSGATFEVRNDLAMHPFAPVGGQFQNQGTFIKAAGTGTTRLNVTLLNTGEVRVRSGRLALYDRSEHDGRVEVDAGAELEIGSGPHIFSERSSLNATGGVFFVPGSSTFHGNYLAASTDLQGAVVHFNGTASSRTTRLAGTLQGTGTYRVVDSMTWTNNGVMRDAGTTRVEGVLTIAGTGSKELRGGRILDNAGTVTWAGTGPMNLREGAVVNNLEGATFDLQSDAGMYDAGSADPVLNNFGTLRKSSGAGVSSLFLPVFNAGLVEVLSGTLQFGAGYTQTNGVTRLAGGAIGAPSNRAFEIQGGIVTGAGVIEANVSNGGQMAPGIVAGVLSINGNYTQTTTGTLQIEIISPVPQTGYDELTVTGQAVLGGTLEISVAAGYDPPLGHEFTILTANRVEGRFASVRPASLASGKRLEVIYDNISVKLRIVSP